MASVIATLVLASSANALVGRSSSCCFGLTASGGVQGSLGQLSDGQNRLGQNLPRATYCIKDGGLTDATGRGCILTPPTTQLQCDVSAIATGGFALGCDGTLTWYGQSGFFSCPTGDNGGFNLYTTPPAGQQGCVQSNLRSDECHVNCPVPVVPKPAPKTCPASLSGAFEYPHLIVPIDSSSPDQAHGTSFNGEVTTTVSSIFNFDIAPSASGKTCSLVFLFPDQSKLQTSSYTFSGNGQVEFSMLNTAASQSTTFNTAPSVKTDYGMTKLVSGSSTVISTFACPAGEAIGFQMKAGGDTSLTYFQDYNPDPIGLYVTVCDVVV